MLPRFFLLSNFCHRIFSQLAHWNPNSGIKTFKGWCDLTRLQWEICLLLTGYFVSEGKGAIVRHFFGIILIQKNRVSDITLNRYSDVKERNQAPNCRLKCHPHGIKEVKSYHWSIIINDWSFCCPIIYTDTIYNAILFIDTSAMLDTAKVIL